MERQPRLIAFDLGRKMGWAHNCGIAPGLYYYGTQIHRSEQAEYEWMKNMIHPGAQFDAVLYEDVARHVGTQAAHRYGGHLALLRLVCQERGMMLHGVPVGTIKKHATGKGNAGKDLMLEAARLRLACEPEDDNAADALWLLDYALANNVFAVGQPEGE